MKIRCVRCGEVTELVDVTDEDRVLAAEDEDVRWVLENGACPEPFCWGDLVAA